MRQHAYQLRVCAALRAAQTLVLAFCLTGVAAAIQGHEPKVMKVEPPNWWTGYVSPVMVLLYGHDLEGARITVSEPGVHISRTDVQPDGEHAFVWLDLDPSVKPGTLTIHLSTGAGRTDAGLLLRARSSPKESSRASIAMMSST